MGDDKKSLATIFLTFFRIGLFTFGGGFAMIPLMEEEIVIKHNWVDKEKFIDAISITQSVPGAVAVNLSIYFGYNLAGFIGAVIATLGVALPSFLIILLIAIGFNRFSQYQVVANIFKGIRPAVVGLIIYAGIDLSRHISWSASLILTLVVTIGANFFLGINPVILITIAILVGMLVHFNDNRKEKTKENQGRVTHKQTKESV